MSYKIKTIRIDNQHGEVLFHVYDSSKFNDEEDSTYIPKEIKMVGELAFIKVSEPNKGFGSILMKEFLKIAESEVELILLDLNTEMAEELYTSKPDDEVLFKLSSFYEKFGFVHEGSSQRMYRNNSRYNFPNKQY